MSTVRQFCIEPIELAQLYQMSWTTAINDSPALSQHKKFAKNVVRRLQVFTVFNLKGLLDCFTGYEFDPGIHYIGQMDSNGSARFLSDQLTEGQLVWVPLEKEYDTVVIGNMDNLRAYPISGGRQQEYQNALYKKFPKERKAIDQYMQMLRVSYLVVILFEVFTCVLVSRAHKVPDLYSITYTVVF